LWCDFAVIEDWDVSDDVSKEAELNYTKAGTGHCQLHPYYFALLHPTVILDWKYTC
jgi:hypothetical protein